MEDQMRTRNIPKNLKLLPNCFELCYGGYNPNKLGNNSSCDKMYLGFWKTVL